MIAQTAGKTVTHLALGLFLAIGFSEYQPTSRMPVVRMPTWPRAAAATLAAALATKSSRRKKSAKGSGAAKILKCYDPGMPRRIQVFYRIASALWLGSVVFLAFALSPVAFGLVAPAERGLLLGWSTGAAFPLALGAGTATALALAWRARHGERHQIVVRGVLVAGALMLCGLAFWLGLGMDEAQRAAGEVFWQLPDASGERRLFDRAHRDAEGMLGVALLILVVIVGLG